VCVRSTPSFDVIGSVQFIVLCTYFSSLVMYLVCERVTIVVSKLILSFITVLTVYFSLLTGEYHTLPFPMMVLQPIREY